MLCVEVSCCGCYLVRRLTSSVSTVFVSTYVSSFSVVNQWYVLLVSVLSVVSCALSCYSCMWTSVLVISVHQLIIHVDDSGVLLNLSHCRLFYSDIVIEKQQI